jgi:hypothetical protein
MADLSISFSDLYNKVSEFYGTGSSPTGTDLTNAKAKAVRGYRRFLFSADARTGKRHIWSFLKQYATITTSQGQYKYALPSDFGRTYLDFIFDKSQGYSSLKKRSAGFILQERCWADMSGYPECYAIVPAKYDVTVGTTWDLWLYPTPNGAYLLHYFYLISPKKPENASDILIGGIEASEAIIESALAVVEDEDDEMSTTHHTQLATKLIQDLIIGDTVDLADSVGRMIDPEIMYGWKDRPPLAEIDDASIYA